MQIKILDKIRVRESINPEKAAEAKQTSASVSVFVSLGFTCFYINITCSSLLQPDSFKNLNFACENTSQYNIDHSLIRLWVNSVKCSLSTCFLSKNWFCWGKTLFQIFLSSHPHLQISLSPLPVLDYNFNMYFWH